MKRILLYIIVLLLAVAIPEHGTDVGKLMPVEAVLLRTEGEMIVIETDTADSGRGETVHAALQDLKDTTAGTVFLDTADYLLATEDTMQHIKDIESYLKKSVGVCRVQQVPDLLGAAEYLAVHKPDTTIKSFLETGEIQHLFMEGERLKLG